MLPTCYFYWFRKDTKHITELWLDQALMECIQCIQSVYSYYWFRKDTKQVTEPWLDQALLDSAYKSVQFQGVLHRMKQTVLVPLSRLWTILSSVGNPVVCLWTIILCGEPCIMSLNYYPLWGTLYYVYELLSSVGNPVVCLWTIILCGEPCIMSMNYYPLWGTLYYVNGKSILKVFFVYLYSLFVIV